MTEPEWVATFDEATRLSPYEAARRWADRTRYPTPPDVVRELDDLALTCALNSWTARWRPTTVHTALLAGASMEQVCAATGMGFAELAAEWREWARGQRHLNQTVGVPDVRDLDRVEAMFTEAERSAGRE
jgi:hypothetical protein